MTSPASSSGRFCASEPLWARPTAERTASTMTTSVMCMSPRAQFRSGLLFMSMYCMRSWLFGSPHRLTKASRSSSRISSSVTSRGGAADAAAQHRARACARSARRARWRSRRRPACRPSSPASRCRSRRAARRRAAPAGGSRPRPGRSRAAWPRAAGARGRTTRRRCGGSSRTPCASSALVATLASGDVLEHLGHDLVACRRRRPRACPRARATACSCVPAPPGMRPTPTSTRPE